MTNGYREKAAAAARAYIRGELPWDRFIEEFGESEDDLISDVVDLIEHEPKRGGFMGVNESDWAAYRTKLDEAVRRLES